MPSSSVSNQSNCVTFKLQVHGNDIPGVYFAMVHKCQINSVARYPGHAYNICTLYLAMGGTSCVKDFTMRTL